MTTELQAALRDNQRIQRELYSAVRRGAKYPGAKFFVWGKSLHFGIVKERTAGHLRGNYVTLCEADMDIPEYLVPRVLGRMAKAMNAALP